MKSVNSITAIILAGGKSKRMGTDKGLLLFKQKPMIAHSIDTATQLTNRILIISNNMEYLRFGYPVFSDVFKNLGPLAGIYTGLLHSTTFKNIILGCDIPNVTPQLIKTLINNSNNYDVTIPKNNGMTEQLIGIYTKNCQDVLKDQIEKQDLKIKNAYKHLNVNTLLIDGNHPDYKKDIFKNVNSSKDL